MKTDRNKRTAVSFKKCTLMVGGKKLLALTGRRKVLMPRANQDLDWVSLCSLWKDWEDEMTEEAQSSVNPNTIGRDPE